MAARRGACQAGLATGGGTDRQSAQVLEAFRGQRESLLAAWLEPAAEKPAKQAATIQEKRAAKAAKMLAAWLRKSKLAATKVKRAT